MRGRIRIAAVGLVALTLLCAVSSSAGAQSTPWSVQSNGGFVSLDLLNTLQFAGGGSEADASNAPMAEASGTGACLSTASSTNPCPTSATSSLSGLASTTTQDAVAKGNGVTATPTGSSACTVPIDTGLVNVNVSCGTASASEDGSGEPDGVGHRQPGQRVDQPEPDRRAAEHARRLAAVRLVGVRRRPGRLRLGGVQLEPAPVVGVSRCSAP